MEREGRKKEEKKDDSSQCGSGQIWLDGSCHSLFPGSDDDDDITPPPPDGSPSSELIGPGGGELVLANASLGVPPDAIVGGGQATYSIEPLSTPPAGIATGKFHGGTTATTPSGEKLAPSIVSRCKA